MFCSVAFYGALIVRYNIFRKNNLVEIMVSVIRTFLDCWVLAGLISMIITSGDNEAIVVSIFKVNICTILLFAVILSWLGMKTIAGYSWILFFLAGIDRFEKINNAMGTMGAVFIITTAISLFLQIEDYSNIKDFVQEFRSISRPFFSQVRGDMRVAGDDLKGRAQDATQFVMDTVSGHVPFGGSSATNEQSTENKHNLEDIKMALDVNGDGVFDEKDIAIINRAKDQK